MSGLKKAFFILIISLFVFSHIETVYAIAADDIIPLPNINIAIGGPTEDGEGSASSAVQLLFLLTVISLAPSLLIMMTSFTRIIIILHFVRSALGTQQMPPNQVLVGLALFLTLFIMGPIFSEVNETAIVPYSAGEISQSEFLDIAMGPIRDFMFDQAEPRDVALFANLAGIDELATRAEVPNRVLIPAFILGEITKGFIFGFMIFVPFIVIDMVVASVLMAMGMMMLPPAMISLPFKILLFVLVDGWSYVIEILVRTFR